MTQQLRRLAPQHQSILHLASVTAACSALEAAATDELPRSSFQQLLEAAAQADICTERGLELLELLIAALRRPRRSTLPSAADAADAAAERRRVMAESLLTHELLASQLESEEWETDSSGASWDTGHRAFHRSKRLELLTAAVQAADLALVMRLPVCLSRNILWRIIENACYCGMVSGTWMCKAGS